MIVRQRAAIRQGHGAGLCVNRVCAGIKAQINLVIDIKRSGTQIEPFLGHVALQIGLGQRRTLVWRHRLDPDHGDLPVKPLAS